MAGLGVLGADVLVDEVEGQLGSAADELLDMLRIVDAGELDEDAVLPLALNDRFLGAGLVDAPAYDLDRLLDRRAGARFERDRVGLQRDVGAVRGQVYVGIDLLDDGADVIEP